MYSGWTQVAFDEDLVDEVAPVDIGNRALVAVRRSETYAVYDARCPHRGAHLGYGGRLEGDALVCPFHGHRVHLREQASGHEAKSFCVRPYPTVHAAKGLFILLDEGHDTGLGARLAQIDRTHHVRPAFTREISVPPEFVIENVLDAGHFAEVHGLTKRPHLEVSEEGGSLLVRGRLETLRPNKWQVAEAENDDTRVHLLAQVFSPNIVVTELSSGQDKNIVITSATSKADGGCTARVTVALPRTASTGVPTVRQLSSLISGSRMAFDQDTNIWEHLDLTVSPRYMPSDRMVRVYRDFCDRFGVE